MSDDPEQLRQTIAELQSCWSAVLHDLWAPVRAINGFSRAVMEDYGDRLDENGKDYLASLVKASMRLDSLLRDVQSYVRLFRTELRLQEVSLSDVIEEVLTRVRTGAGEKLDVDVPPNLPAVMADRALLLQMVEQLMKNAATFVAPDVVPKVRIRTEGVATSIRLSVEDNGIGIALRNQERIFAVMERLNRMESYPGNGMGLAFVRKGATLMGGSVGLESEEGRGSRFWLDLPRA